MEDLKKSQEVVLRERIEELERENKELTNTRDMYEDWWRKADAKNMELAEAVKSIVTIAGMICKTAKA